MLNTFTNVADFARRTDCCIGCGVCAGVCPSKRLSMRMNSAGQYQPVTLGGDCPPNCTICSRVCPFGTTEENESTLAEALYGQIDGTSLHPVGGYSIASYVGHVLPPGQRFKRSSGGIASWVLSELLRTSKVDRVICVVGTGNGDKLFRYAVLDRPADVLASSRSCYYPVELSEVLQEILRHEARYAIIGPPCFVKALRLASGVNKRLRHRLTHVLGLVCGQSQSTLLAEYLCALCGVDPRCMTGASFRVKSLDRPASDFGFQFSWDEGGVIRSKTIFWSEGIGLAWQFGFFRPSACDLCDDIFAETADAAFMDAWLPQFETEARGSTIALVRTPEIRAILQDGIAQQSLFLEEIPLEQTVASQKGLERKKRGDLAKRLYRRQRALVLYTPCKRVEKRQEDNLLEWLTLNCMEMIRQTGRKAFALERTHQSARAVARRAKGFYLVLRLLGKLSRLLGFSG